MQTKTGFYCKTLLFKKIVFKRISVNSNFERSFLLIQLHHRNLSTRGVLVKYVQLLQANELEIPRTIFIGNKYPLCIQKRITGMTLQEFLISSTTSTEQALVLLKEFFSISVKMKDSVVAVDLSTKNFMVHDSKLICVDLIPPLFKSAIPFTALPKTSTDILLNAYVDLNYQLCKALYYSLLELNTNNASEDTENKVFKLLSTIISKDILGSLSKTLTTIQSIDKRYRKLAEKWDHFYYR